MRATFACLWMIALTCFAPSVHAQNQQLDQVYPKIVLDQDVEVVLRQLTEDTGIPVVVDRAIDGVVRNDNPDLSAREFLDAILAPVAATWYYNNGFVYVAPMTEVEQILFDVADVPTGNLSRAFAGIEMQSGRPPITIRSDGLTAIATGSPDYLRLASELVALEGGFVLGQNNDGEQVTVSSEPEAEVINEEQTMSVFRGRVSR